VIIISLASHFGSDWPVREYFIGSLNRSVLRVTSVYRVGDEPADAVGARKTLVLQ
jgi:hypothetical protein